MTEVAPPISNSGRVALSSHSSEDARRSMRIMRGTQASSRRVLNKVPSRRLQNFKTEQSMRLGDAIIRQSSGRSGLGSSISGANASALGYSLGLSELSASLVGSSTTLNMSATLLSVSNRWANETIKFQANQFVEAKGGTLEDNYLIGELLGEGGFGEVYEAQHIDSGAERAVKVMEKQDEDEQNEKIVEEFNIVKDLDHPNILRLYELFEDDEYFYIVSDIYRGGELYDTIAEWDHLPEEAAAILMTNILSCINYCHKKNLVHRDLKPENILLEESRSFDDLKIIDFGLATFHDAGNSITQREGSVYYMSPQVVKGRYGNKCDIWSCGVIAFLAMAGYAPFDGDDDKQVVDSIRKGHFSFDDPVWDEVSTLGKDFIKYLLTYEEEERPTAEEALNHPWLQRSRRKSTKRSNRRASTRQSLGCLHSFQANSKLKQAACSFIASQLLLKEEKEEIDNVFRSLDMDCDGKLTKEDIHKSYLEFIGTELSEDDINAMFRHVNYSNTGAIEYSEFVVASLFEKNMIDDMKLERAFSHFDKDDKGHITRDDIKAVLGVGDDMDGYVANKIIREVDENGDGVICFDEFRDMMFSNAVIPPPPRRSSSKDANSKCVVEGPPPQRGLRRSGVSGSICSLGKALGEGLDDDDEDTTEELTPSFYGSIDEGTSFRSVYTMISEKNSQGNRGKGDDNNGKKKEKKSSRKKSISHVFRK